jgi:excisionase family DNA binding protein
MICDLVSGTLHWHVAVCQGLDAFRFARSEEVLLENLLSVEEAARRLGGISKWTIHAWLSRGRLQRTKVGRRTMIRESELQRVIRDGDKSRAPGRRGRKRTTGESEFEHRK